MYLHEQEDILFEEWKNSYPSDVRENIVIDGLCVSIRRNAPFTL